MSGFVGLNELFIKLQLKFEFKLSELEKNTYHKTSLSIK